MIHERRALEVVLMLQNHTHDVLMGCCSCCALVQFDLSLSPLMIYMCYSSCRLHLVAKKFDESIVVVLLKRRYVLLFVVLCFYVAV